MKKEHFVLAVAIVVVLLGALGWEKWKERNPPKPSQEQKAYVEIVPERALFDNVAIRVVVAAKIRPEANIDRIEFVHVGGYFVDQTGTSYSPGFTRVNNSALPTFDEIDPFDHHILRRGETYRYCLGPAEIEVDDTSGETAANAIKKVTVYLADLPSTTVPVARWRGLDPTSDNPNDWR